MPRRQFPSAALLGMVALLASLRAPAQELCPNGGFESGNRNWTVVLGGYGALGADWTKAAKHAVISGGEVHGGKAALTLDANGVPDEVDAYSDPMTVKPGFGYRLGSFVKQYAGTAGFKVTIDWQDATGKHLAYDNDWQGANKPKSFSAHGGVFVGPKDVGRAVIILGVQQKTRCAFDDISFRELGAAEPLDARPRLDGDGSAAGSGPPAVGAMQSATWEITYTVGQSGLLCGGAIRIARSNVSFDWPEFQTDRPDAPGFASVRADRDAEFTVGGGRDLTLRLNWPALQPGDRVQITLGNSAQDSGRVPVQRRLAKGIEWIVETDGNADGTFARVGAVARFDVVPGPPAAHVLIAPATAEVGQPVSIIAERCDAAGNVVTGGSGEYALAFDQESVKAPERVVFAEGVPARAQFEVSWTAPGYHQVTLVAGPDGKPGVASIVVSRPTAELAQSAPNGAQLWPGGDVTLANDCVCAVIPKNPGGYGYVALYTRIDGDLRQVAALPSLGAVTWAALSGNSRLTAQSVAQADSTVALAGTVRTPRGKNWPFTATLELAPGRQHIAATFTLTPNTREEIVAFRGPWLCAGEGGSGEQRLGALFPGIEYLTDGEVSSDDKGVAYGLSQRYAPHPYKVTVPVMAVAQPQAVVALAWDPAQKWDRTHSVPQPCFAVPNRLEGQTNNLMALDAALLPDSDPKAAFPPPVRPWTTEPGARLALSADLMLLGGARDVTEAVRYYCERHPLPKPILPRSYAQDLDLCARGYLETAWSAKDRGWLSAIGLQHAPDQGLADQMLQLALLTDDATIAKQLRAQVAEALGNVAPSAAALGLRRGDPTLAIAGLRRAAADSARAQHPEGYWTFGDVYDTKGQKGTLAAAGDVELGTCVYRLGPILNWALVSGDPEALAAGLRTLEYMKRFNRPAGAESWEVPLCNPNLRAAALACEGYIDGYRLSGNREYLDLARRWAWAGMAFIYHWEAPDRPVMPGASISVFGTTFYTHPWFGAAVQWVGLAYANSLQKLAPWDESYPWRDVSALIVSSAMKQQKTDAAPCKHVGFYPDSYYVVKGEDYYEWCLAPTLLAENVIGLLGRQPGVQTAIPAQAKQIRITTVAQTTAVGYNAAEKTLTAELRYYPGETAYTVLFGLSLPESAEFGGKALAREDRLTAAVTGWTVPARERFLALKLKWTQETGTLVLHGVSPVAFEPVETARVIGNGGFEEGLKDWNPEPAATLDTTDPYSGKAALLISALAGEVQCGSAPVTVEGGKLYRLSSWVKLLAGTGSYKVTIDWRDAADGHLAYANDWAGDNHPAQYTQHGGIFRAPDQARAAAIILGARSARYLMDAVQLVRSE